MSHKVHPEFSRELYNQYDTFGKQIVKSFFGQAGYVVADEDEGYSSHDIVFEKDGKQRRVEVEITNCWKYGMFPFPSHHISCRKRLSRADTFVQCNNKGTAIAVCDMSVVLNGSIVKKNCRMPDGRMTCNEPFFSVPVEKMKYYFYEDGEWWQYD